MKIQDEFSTAVTSRVATMKDLLVDARGIEALFVETLSYEMSTDEHRSEMAMPLLATPTWEDSSWRELIAGALTRGSISALEAVSLASLVAAWVAYLDSEDRYRTASVVDYNGRLTAPFSGMIRMDNPLF